MKKETDKFIETFNNLEKYLRITLKEKSPNYFKEKLRVAAKKNRVINSNYDFLTTATDLRNLIVHQGEIALPTEDFNDKFVDIVKKITHPDPVTKCMVNFSSITSANYNSEIMSLIEQMKKKNLSNIPVIEDDITVGVFNENVFFNYYLLNGEMLIDESMTLNEISDAIKFDNQPSSYYKFIKRKTNVYEALDLFLKGYENDKKLELLFVTEHGKKSEKVLGLVTIWDLQHYMV